MKMLTRLALLCSLILGNAAFLAAQQFPRPYLAKIFTNDSVVHGILFRSSDSALVLVPQNELALYSTGKKYDSVVVPYRVIRHLRVWRGGKFWRTLVSTSLFECGFGMLAGNASNGEAGDFVLFTRQQATLIGGVVGLLSGLVTGTIFGLLKNDIWINGNGEKFNVHVPYFRQHSFVKLVYYAK